MFNICCDGEHALPCDVLSLSTGTLGNGQGGTEVFLWHEFHCSHSMDRLPAEPNKISKPRVLHSQVKKANVCAFSKLADYSQTIS